jgi:hypothetical protein
MMVYPPAFLFITKFSDSLVTVISILHLRNSFNGRPARFRQHVICKGYAANDSAAKWLDLTQHFVEAAFVS